MSELTLDIKPRSSIHSRLVEWLNDRYVLSANRMSRLQDKWRKAEEQHIAYMPERDVDAKRRILHEQQGKPQYRTIMLPYTYAMLMSAHSYWTTVFLGRNPVFQYNGRHGETQQQTQALEALIDYQLQVGEMMVPIYFWLLDAGKYGLGVVGEYWDEEITSVSKVVEEQPSLLGIPILGRAKKTLVSEQIRGYYGNKLFNIRPYDYFPDPRVPLHAVQRGEYVGYYTEVGMHEIAARANQGALTNIEFLDTKGLELVATAREQGSPQIELPNDDGAARINEQQNRTGPYGLMTFSANIVPQQLGLSEVGTHEKWMFTAAVRGRATGGQESHVGRVELILGARPLGCLHNKHPFSVLEMEPEPYALASRGMPEIIRPLQHVMDWLVNSHMYNVRKTMNNQFLVDPSRVVMETFNDPIPGGAVLAKPNAYGSDMKTAVSQLPVTDVTRAHLGDMANIHEFAQRALGVNDQIMGLLNQGGRKTASEIRTSSTFGVNRQKTISEFFSVMGFAPLASRLVQNSQQYYDGEMKFKIVGDLIQEAGPRFVQVTPDLIAGMYDFVPVDGTMPVDRYAQANLWRELFMSISKVPQVAMQYDLGRIFAWVAQLAGLKNINQFKVQVMPPGMNPQLAGQGNVVPLNRQNMEAAIEPGQISGMGTTG